MKRRWNCRATASCCSIRRVRLCSSWLSRTTVDLACSPSCARRASSSLCRRRRSIWTLAWSRSARSARTSADAGEFRACRAGLPAGSVAGLPAGRVAGLTGLRFACDARRFSTIRSTPPAPRTGLVDTRWARSERLSISPDRVASQLHFAARGLTVSGRVVRSPLSAVKGYGRPMNAPDAKRGPFGSRWPRIVVGLAALAICLLFVKQYWLQDRCVEIIWLLVDRLSLAAWTALILLSAMSFGAALLRWLKLRPSGDGATALFGVGLGLAVLSTLVLGLGALGFIEKFSWVVALVALLYAGLRDLGVLLRAAIAAVRRARRAPSFRLALWAVLGFFLLPQPRVRVPAAVAVRRPRISSRRAGGLPGCRARLLHAAQRVREFPAERGDAVPALDEPHRLARPRRDPRADALRGHGLPGGDGVARTDRRRRGEDRRRPGRGDLLHLAGGHAVFRLRLRGTAADVLRHAGSLGAGLGLAPQAHAAGSARMGHPRGDGGRLRDGRQVHRRAPVLHPGPGLARGDRLRGERGAEGNPAPRDPLRGRLDALLQPVADPQLRRYAQPGLSAALWRLPQRQLGRAKGRAFHAGAFTRRTCSPKISFGRPGKRCLWTAPRART